MVRRSDCRPGIILNSFSFCLSRFRWLVLFLAFAGLKPLWATAAPDTGLAGVVFQSPAGWARDDSQPNQVLFSSPDNQSNLLLMAGARPKGDFQAIFLRVVRASLGSGLTLASGPVLSAK